MLLLVLTCTAQEKTRIVEGPKTRFKDQPVEIVGWEVGDKKFIDKNRVAADKDWLKELSLSVKNISKRNIQFFEVDILIRKNGWPVIGIPVRFYSNPALSD